MNRAATAASENAGVGLEPVFEEHRLQAGHGIISYRECGHGPQTVVLLHGISSGAASWSQCAGILGRHARVIAWNAPGYADSSPLPMPVPSALDYARQLAALLAGLNVESCLLVGHSLGALMAAAYGSATGHLASRIVLMSPALGYQSEEKKPLADSVRAKRFQALEQDGLEAIAKRLPDRLLTASASPAQRASVTQNALRLNPAGYRQAVEMLCSEDIERYVLDAGSAQVFCGDRDVVTTPEQSAAFAQRAGLPFALIENAGHACYVEQPAVVANLLSGLLARLGSEAG